MLGSDWGIQSIGWWFCWSAVQPCYLISWILPTFMAAFLELPTTGADPVAPIWCSVGVVWQSIQASSQVLELSVQLIAAGRLVAAHASLPELYMFNSHYAIVGAACKPSVGLKLSDSLRLSICAVQARWQSLTPACAPWTRRSQPRGVRGDQGSRQQHSSSRCAHSSFQQNFIVVTCRL